MLHSDVYRYHEAQGLEAQASAWDSAGRDYNHLLTDTHAVRAAISRNQAAGDDVPTAPTQCLVDFLKEFDPLGRFAQVRRYVRSGRCRRGPPGTVLMVGDLEPATQTGIRDPGVLRELAQRRPTLASHSDGITSELGRQRLRYEIDPSSKEESSSQEST